jgi:hypothetical protein
VIRSEARRCETNETFRDKNILARPRLSTRILDSCETLITCLVQEKKDTWEYLLAEMTEKYASSSAEDRARAFKKAMKFKQKSDEELRTYTKRAKKLAKKIDPALEKAVAPQFLQGISNKNLQVMIAANSESKTVYTFKEVHQAVQAVARARKRIQIRIQTRTPLLHLRLRIRRLVADQRGAHPY